MTAPASGGSSAPAALPGTARASASSPTPGRPGPVRALADVRPSVPPARLLADLVPPRHFADARFSTYRANPAYPSQARTVARLEEVAAAVVKPARKGLFGARKQTAPAVYMDGGFGVGKTHLLTSLAHAVGLDVSAYGTFVEYTNLVGALGFRATVDALATKKLVCIDEFELDDPGDTVLMSRLLRELADRGVALAATSNTLPEALGEGRFAAEDFLREIQALAARFEVLRVDGEDYRHRAVVTDSAPLPEADVRTAVTGRPGATLDAFDDLLAHLSQVHPSRYRALLDGVEVVALTGVHPVTEQSAALRLVVLVDRLYDRDVPVLLAGTGAYTGERSLFTEEMLRGGYRKKYYRALSRLGALAEDGRTVARGAA
ncbi:cell division protein ZapE [Cellulosimicrobium cellulans]|uniref:cell division protein ZapE n=1 Tax=Cellulosimicrobium TaxID=157920 RepID=UPI00087E69F4|nr:cell division protein ZapE [Cellulosimicrobium cellulans]SDF47742.1 cell division protein ZapE [Cellulosimicrobium cellulans]